METKSTGLKAPSIRVELSPECLQVCIDDPRADILAKFQRLNTEQQGGLALDAWNVGLRAVLNAHTQAEEARLADVGRTLCEDLDKNLTAQLKHQHDALTAALKHFFDPTDGQLGRRLESFVKDQGELARVLNQFVGNDHSVLARTLAQAVGEQSPLFKRLSTTESDGLVQLLEKRVQAALEQNRDAVAEALDPLKKDGAVGRFLIQLREEIEGADEDQQAQLGKALAALDQNDKNSLISTLLRETREAHDKLRRAIDPLIPDSPLALVTKSIEETLAVRLGNHHERLAEMGRSQAEFQKELRDAVQRLETRKSEQAKSTHGGATFEDDVLAFVQRVVPASLCTVEGTGSRVGARPHCKVGDAVIRFSEESAFAGAGVVIEAKRDAAYGTPSALEELETAMANRECSVGVFVMAKSHAPAGFPRFARFGAKLLVTWDPEDPMTDGLLDGAIVAALALAQRRRSTVDSGDLQALQGIEQSIVKEIERLDSMNASAGKIHKHADDITDEIRKGRKALARLVENAKRTLTALNIELRDDAAEEASPIEVGAAVSRLVSAA